MGPAGDWVRAQRLEDIESRVRECDEAIRAAVEKEERFLRPWTGRPTWDGSRWPEPSHRRLWKSLPGTIVADRVERSGGSLKPAIAILGLGAAGTLLGPGLSPSSSTGRAARFLDPRNLCDGGRVKGWLTLVLDLALWVPATLLVVLAMLFAIWRTRRARKVEEGGRR